MKRRFATRRRVSLSDTDATNRLRLDAAARYFQDVASDDWEDAGFDSDAHVWVVRRTWLRVEEPVVGAEHVELETWCAGVAATAAARRYSLRGDRGGRIQAESIWIHLDRALRPLRLDERFLAVYGESAAGRRASTRLELPAPEGLRGERWPLRATDVDRLGHVNNAAYWSAVEEAFAGELGGTLHATLEYRAPIDGGDAVELARDGDAFWLVVGGQARAAGSIQIARPAPSSSSPE